MKVESFLKLSDICLATKMILLNHYNYVTFYAINIAQLLQTKKKVHIPVLFPDTADPLFADVKIYRRIPYSHISYYLEKEEEKEPFSNVFFLMYLEVSPSVN